MSKIVIAIGGNSLGDTPSGQKEALREVARPLVDLVAEGHQVIIVHGNGPQVGLLHGAFRTASKVDGWNFEMPLCECVAMTQGYIGYHLQNAIRNELNARNLNEHVGTIVCQTIVDPNDTAFQHPDKPIGGYLTPTEAGGLREQGYTVVDDAGRGLRRVVASPTPVGLVEDTLLQTLVDKQLLLIVGGGGGIPVVQTQGRYESVDAVIDKDRSAALIAASVDADYLLVLTGVEQVVLHYGTPKATPLGAVCADDMETYMEEGHFAPGSMLPKVEAAVAFVRGKAGRSALITSLEKASDGLKGLTGTLISNTPLHGEMNLKYAPSLAQHV